MILCTRIRTHHLRCCCFLIMILYTSNIISKNVNANNLYTLRSLINCRETHQFEQCSMNHQSTLRTTPPSPIPPSLHSNENSLTLIGAQQNGLHRTMLLTTLLSTTTPSSNKNQELTDQQHNAFDQISFDLFCELMSFTSFFAVKKDIILVSSKEHQQLIDRYENKECTNILKKGVMENHVHTHYQQQQTNNRDKVNDDSIVHHWYIDTYEAKIIQSSIEDWMNEGMQRFVLVCSLECTSLVLQIGSAIQFYEVEPIFFVFYRTPLYILTKLPRMVIAMERQPVKTTNRYKNKNISVF